MANLWFKFYGGEYLSDPKIERLSPLERSCWITILCMASMGKDGVIEFLTVESLLNRSGIHFDPYHPEEWEKALSVLVKFKSLKMIDASKDGEITVINWEKRQEHNLTVAERVAKSRVKSKSVTTNVTNVTSEKNRIEKNRIDTTLAPASDAIFIFKDYLKELENHKSRHINVIGHYFEEKGITFDNRTKANTAIKRHLRPAREVANFSDQEIVKATTEAKKQYGELWTVETLLKVLTR